MKDERWLPDFCRPMAVFGVVVLAQLVVLLVLYAPTRTLYPGFEELGAASLFAQWLALMSAAMLCLLRPVLSKLSPMLGWPLACLIPILITAGGSAAVHWLDGALALGLSVPRDQGLRFIVGNTLVCALVTFATLRYFHMQSLASQRLRAQTRAQLDALQARIRPHFLFNAMNTIASLIPTRPEVAETAVEDLCELFRASLSDEQRNTRVADELAVVRRYLAIEALRLGDRLQVEWQIDEQTLDLPLSPLLLQPLVENAVYHGIQARAQGGELRISVQRDAQLLTLQVGNPSAPGGSVHHGLGMAQINIRQRLEYLYAGRARLEVEARPDYHQVSLRIPIT